MPRNMLILNAENATECPKPFHWISIGRVTDNGDNGDNGDDDDIDLE